MIAPRTLKGFRDFLPKEARKRQYVLNTLKEVFEGYDYDPLETPALEYEEILTGKYGEEGDNLMYRFEDNGKRRVAMRYDQTVPLARVVAQYQNELPMPFKRYQIQPVWRAENTQKGRYREFIQCDADIVGSYDSTADAQIIITATAGLYALGFKNFTVLINDRTLFDNLSSDAIIAIDKLKKIGEEGVCNELVKRNITETFEEAQQLLQSITNKEPTERLSEVLQIIEFFKKGILEGINFKFSPTLARGLNYYTSTIFEIEIEGYDVGSVCGGGRYDNLIGMFTDKQIPAVGFAYGFDRIMEAMENLNLFPPSLDLSPTKVLITIFSEDLKNNSLALVNLLRNESITAEIYLGDKGTKIEKQLKYADQKNIPYVVIIGAQEVEKKLFTLKNLKTREQKQLTQDELIATLIAN